MESILQIKKVLNKRNMMNNLEDRFKDMNLEITRFCAKYIMLTQAGLLDIHALNEKLMAQKDYDSKIRAYAKEQVSKPLPQGSPTGKVILEYFENLFFLQNEIKHIFMVKPNFAKYTEADESYRKLKSMRIPSAEQWQEFSDLL